MVKEHRISKPTTTESQQVKPIKLYQRKSNAQIKFITAISFCTRVLISLIMLTKPWIESNVAGNCCQDDRKPRVEHA